MGLFDPEAAVGQAWHRWVGEAPSLPRHARAAVALDEVQGRLRVFFRALGGDGAVRIVAGTAGASRHRLRLRQKAGLGGEERLAQASLDGETLQLPARLDCFAERRLNERLYVWLAAFFAHARAPGRAAADPLQADLALLSGAREATRHALAAWPGLRPAYAELCAGARAMRARGALPPWEAAVEEAALQLLGGPAPASVLGREALERAEHGDWEGLVAPRGYRPMLPVPLWGRRLERRAGAPARREDDEPGTGKAGESEERRYRGARRPSDQAGRRDSLILSRFEYLLSVAEMLNANRDVRDEEPEAARRAADALDEIALGSGGRRPASRLRMDLELERPAVDRAPLGAALAYPEWDYRGRRHLPGHCRVLVEPAAEAGDDWAPDAAVLRRVRAVKRQFEALRPTRRLLPGEPDGDELDLDALIRSAADLRAGGAGSDRVYRRARRAARDIAVTVLLDASLSTDGWIDNRRVLDVEKEALLALSHALAACGDDFEALAFTSRTRRRVSVRTLKGFAEPFGPRVLQRLQALKPGYYTRIGAALRHATAGLRRKPNRHRLLLLLTDGKPNDTDHYEGRYGIEDTRRAVQEARRAGLALFGITVDRRAREYFPYLFGPGGYAVVGHLGRLPGQLPALYRQITA